MGGNEGLIAEPTAPIAAPGVGSTRDTVLDPTPRSIEIATDPPQRTAGNSKAAIVAAARDEIERTGILGLRMAEVASRAGVSDTLIYKYFGDRNGLLTEALAEMWHEYVSSNLEAARSAIRGLSDEELTPEVFAATKARPSDDEQRRRRWMRIQILAASLEIPELRRRLGEEQRRVQSAFEEISNEHRERLEHDGFAVDARVEGIITMAAGIGLVLSDLLEDDALTDEESVGFWTAYHRLVGWDDPRLD